MQKELDKIKRDKFVNQYYKHLEQNQYNDIIQDIVSAKDNFVDHFQLITIACSTNNAFAIEKIFQNLSEKEKTEYLHLSMLFATGSGAINILDYFLETFPQNNTFINKMFNHAITLKQPKSMQYLIDRFKHLELNSLDNIKAVCESKSLPIVNILMSNIPQSVNLYNLILEHSMNANAFDIATLAIDLGADVNHNNNICINTAVSQYRHKAVVFLGKMGADLTYAINSTRNEEDKNLYLSIQLSILEEKILNKTKPKHLSSKKKNLNL